MSNKLPPRKRFSFRKSNAISQVMGTEDFGVGRGRMIACSLAINILSLALPIVTLQVYDRIIANNAISTLNVLTVGVLIAVLLESVLRLARSYVTSWAGASFEHKVSCEAMKHVLKAKIVEVEKQSPGEYLNRMTAISKLREFYSGYTLITLIDLPFAALFVGLIAYLAGSIVLVPAAMLALFVTFAMRKGKSVKRALAQRDIRDEERYNFILETLSGIHTVKSGAFENAFARRYEHMQAKCSQANFKVARDANHIFNYGYLFTNMLTCLVVAFGAIKTVDGNMTMGTLVACVLLSGRVMQPVQRAMALWSRYQDFELSIDQVDSLFNLQTVGGEEVLPLLVPQGTVDLDEVSYSYGAKKVLDKISLKLKPGQCIALTSDTSNGKTTLLKILAGIYQPNFGIVNVNGIEPHHYQSKDIINHVGYLSTQGVIYRGTIAENLTRFGATPSARAYELASLLGIDDEVARLPNGYNTLLEGSTADSIPPGLKQRIAIARVLACKPKIILFDHADRALDREGYNEVYKLLGKLKGKATMVIVSSDRNLLRLADVEYSLQDGKLVPNDDYTNSRVTYLNYFREAR